MKHYDKDYQYTFQGRAEQIRDHRTHVLDTTRGRDNNDALLVEHVRMLSTTVESLLIAFAKMVESDR